MSLFFSTPFHLCFFFFFFFEKAIKNGLKNKFHLHGPKKIWKKFSNAFIFPVVYFFYPETAGRSLEEMDSIFRKCHSWFTLVQIARDEPRRFGRKGELLINYEDTEDRAERRASTVVDVTDRGLQLDDAV